MSNHFRLHSNHSNTDEWLSISNGGTTVFLTVLGLSGSRIAITDKEKELLIWIIEHDQTVYGLGNAGFDIAEMPWDCMNYEDERRFIIKVINSAKQKIGWETLAYQPSEDRIFSYLDSFQRLISCFT